MNPGSVHDSELFKKLELLLIIQMKILHIKITIILLLLVIIILVKKLLIAYRYNLWSIK